MILLSSLNTHFRKKSVLCNSSWVISLSRCPTNKDCGEEQGTPETGPRWCYECLPACRWGWQSSLLRATHPWFSWELRGDGSGGSLRALWTPNLIAAGKLEIGSYKRRWYTLHRVLLELPCLQLAQTQRPLQLSRIMYFCRVCTEFKDSHLFCVVILKCKPIFKGHQVNRLQNDPWWWAAVWQVNIKVYIKYEFFNVKNKVCFTHMQSMHRTSTLTGSLCITYFPEGRLKSPQRDSETLSTCSSAWT